MKTYCPHCGGLHEYSAVRPNFCSDCGKPMKSGAAASYTPTNYRPAYYPEPERTGGWDSISSADIVPDTIEKKDVKFEEVFRTGPTEDYSPRKRKTMTKKEFEEYSKSIMERNVIEIAGGDERG